jgi:hypothetical protein
VIFKTYEYKGSSGSIVSDYGLDDRVSRFDSRQGQRIFLLAPASRPALRLIQPPIQWVPGVLSPGVKRGRGVTLTTHPHLTAEVKYEKELYLLSPRAPPWRVAGHLYEYKAVLGSRPAVSSDIRFSFVSIIHSPLISSYKPVQFIQLRISNIRLILYPNWMFSCIYIALTSNIID